MIEQRCEYQPHQDAPVSNREYTYIPPSPRSNVSKMFCALDIYNELLQAPGAKVTFVFINNILLAATAVGAAASADAAT